MKCVLDETSILRVDDWQFSMDSLHKFDSEIKINRKQEEVDEYTSDIGEIMVCQVCHVCGGSPCDWLKYKCDILEAFGTMKIAEGTRNHLI